MRLAFRGYSDGKLVFEERVDLVDADDDQLEDLVESHLVRLGDAPRQMIEIEFLDEPDPLQRFFRIGTDPRGMVEPIAIRLKK